MEVVISLGMKERLGICSKLLNYASSKDPHEMLILHSIHSIIPPQCPWISQDPTSNQYSAPEVILLIVDDKTTLKLIFYGP